MAIVSTVKNVYFDVAGAAHNCSSNKKHRIQKGEKRFNVKVGRSPKTYCLNCGLKAIIKGLEKLSQLKVDVESK